jgi:hypothetical protein
MTPQTKQHQQTDDLAQIRQAALDYAQGWYEGDVERVRRSLHSELAKRRILRDPQTGEERLRHVSQQLMLDLTQQGGGSEDVPADERYYDISVLDVFGDIASARADTYEYVDYLHLARSQEQWVIVNVLYHLKDDPTSELREPSRAARPGFRRGRNAMTSHVSQEQQVEDSTAIRRTALDYAQGWYEGDAERMRRSLHPGLAKRAILRDSRTGEERFSHLSQQQMVAKTAQGGGRDDAPAHKRYYAVAVLDIYGDIASARADTYEYVDYLHLARSQEQWVIVNVLWKENRDRATQQSEPS